VTWAAGAARASLILIMPRLSPQEDPAARDALLADFALDTHQVEWRFFDAPASPMSTKSWWTARDRIVVELADIVLPVSVRPGGNLSQLIREATASKRIESQFAAPFRQVSHQVHYALGSDLTNIAIRDWKDDFITHWTRASIGPWPGETRAQFYSDLVSVRDRYCRCALDTLHRILREKRIRASAWRIGGSAPMVAFTRLSPIASIPLIRWRPRWTRWSFEPYGIAVHKDFAATRHVGPVRYVTDAEWRALAADEKPLCHRRGRAADVWPAEQEWRHYGDFLLGDAPAEAFHVIVHHADEIPLTQPLTPAPVASLVGRQHA